MKLHHYKMCLDWTGNDGRGTQTYQSYRRDHEITGEGKPAIAASSDPAFRGSPKRYNPEELFVASLSSCHMLWYLHLCAVNGIVVVGYCDEPVGEMAEETDGSGQFTRVTLYPRVRISLGGAVEKAISLHGEAHRFCFLARSVNFPVYLEPTVEEDVT